MNTSTAKAYIEKQHAPYGGCRIAWAIQKKLETTAYVVVKFWHGGQAYFAEVWLECGEPYGEW